MTCAFGRVVLILVQQTLQAKLAFEPAVRPWLASLVPMCKKDEVRKDRCPSYGDAAIQPMPAVVSIERRRRRNQSGKISLDLVDTITGMAFMIMLIR